MMATLTIMKTPKYDLRSCSLKEIKELCQRFHGYGNAGGFAVYSFGVYEEGRLIAAYTWAPPPLGVGQQICPEAPQGVLALSRMVAVPKEERKLKHISKPLKKQMRELIDRTRWPVLVTYSDESQGHTGFVYKCSGWTKTQARKVPFYLNEDGSRASSYKGGHTSTKGLIRGGETWLQRWENWICPSGRVLDWMNYWGWERVPVEGKVWRSGNQAYTYKQKKIGD